MDVSRVSSRSVRFPELIPSSPTCKDCAFFRVDSDVDSGLVFLLCLLCLALCWVLVILECELWERFC